LWCDDSVHVGLFLPRYGAGADLLPPHDVSGRNAAQAFETPPSSMTARFIACVTPESQRGKPLPIVRVKTPALDSFVGCFVSAAGLLSLVSPVLGTRKISFWHPQQT